MNIYIPVFIWSYYFNSHRLIPKSGMSGSYSRYIANTPGNAKLFTNGCTTVHSYQESMRDSVSVYSKQHLI